MKTIEYHGTHYRVPSDWTEFTLEQYIDLYDLSKDTDLDPLSILIRQTAIVSGIPLNVVEAMGYATFEDLVGQVSLSEFQFPDLDRSKVYPEPVNESRKDECSFEIDGITYRMQPDAAWMNVGRMARLEQLLAGRDLKSCLHYILSVCAFHEGENMSSDDVERKAKLFLRIPLERVLDCLLFFYSHEKSYAWLTAISGRRPEILKDLALLQVSRIRRTKEIAR